MSQKKVSSVRLLESIKGFLKELGSLTDGIS
jgi:hypothetical protein